LRYPQRIESAEVYLQEGLPAGRGSDSEDWLTVEYVDEIVVPDDAWSDWDATNQVFITAGERFTETEYAAQKTVIHYPSELFDTTWHDGSNFSVGDIVMHMIMFFDPGKPDSPHFDQSAEATTAAYLQAFKGVRIVSEDPLVIEPTRTTMLWNQSWLTRSLKPLGTPARALAILVAPRPGTRWAWVCSPKRAGNWPSPRPSLTS
jgi:peptide/nickel transport system substrate-binding protein